MSRDISRGVRPVAFSRWRRVGLRERRKAVMDVRFFLIACFC
jgi:hypothetical protein